MTAISNIEFSPGTTITSAWLNGVNDALNNVVSDITSSTARTLTNKALDLVSIKDYGVIGDGSTDDTSAINTALSLFANTNKYLFMPAGTYKVSSTITIPNKTGLIANGDAILYATSAGFSNTVPTTHYTSTSLVVNMSGLTSSPYTPYYNQKLIGIKIEYQFLEGRVVDAIANRNCYNSEIDHCEIYNFPLCTAIDAGSLLHGCKITNNYIHDISTNTNFGGSYTSADVNLYGIGLDDNRVNSVESVGVLISGNFIENLNHGATSIAAYGDQADGISTQKGKGHVVTNNVVVNVNEGIDTYAKLQTISNNYFKSNSGWGIKLIHGASYNTVSNNVVEDAGIGGITLDGGVVDHTQYNLIRGNIVYNVDPNNTNNASFATGCIKIDNQGTFFAKNNIFSENILYPGTNGNYNVILDNPTQDINNTFKNNYMPSAGTDGTWNTDITYQDNEQAFRTAVKVTRSTTQSVNSGAYTKIQFDSELFDTNSEFDSTTNYRWTCVTPGYYRVSANVRMSSVTGLILKLQKNGTTDLVISAAVSATGDQTAGCNDLIKFTTGDYLEAYVFHSTGAARNVTANQEWTHLTVSAI